MRLTARAIIVAAVAAGPLACSRYEPVSGHITPECANHRPPVDTRSFTPEQDSAADSGSIRGRLIESGSGRPLPWTVVRLLTEPLRMTTADSLGIFTFTDVPAGTYLLNLRRIGVHTRTDTLHLQHARSAAFVIPLDIVVMDDPCDLSMIVVRKPWWKFW